jgi:hypothetical protein
MRKNHGRNNTKTHHIYHHLNIDIGDIAITTLFALAILIVADKVLEALL